MIPKGLLAAAVGLAICVAPTSSSAQATPPKPAGSAEAPAPEPMNPRVPGARLVNEVVDQLAPLSAEEVRLMRRLLDERQAAAVAGRAARPTTSVFNVDLSPGAAPPVVRINAHQGSILSFLDSAGRPWPAKLAANFATNLIAAAQFTEHQISVGIAPGPAAIAQVPVNALLAVSLEGLPTAITVSIVSQQHVVDAQVHMVVPRYFGDVPPAVGVISGEPSVAPADLQAFLLRTPPADARPLMVDGLPGALAWQVSAHRMVIRTNVLVVSGFLRRHGLGDGTLVYEIPVSPVIRVAIDGSVRPVHIGKLAAPGDASWKKSGTAPVVAAGKGGGHGLNMEQQVQR